MITKHFSYDEVIKSNVATRMGINNDIPVDIIPAVQLLAENILEKVRIHFNKPIMVTSWYRCPALSQLISNNPKSQHTKGEAVDFIVRGISNMDAAEYIRDNLEFDQLILERNWIHCSLVKEGNRKEVLRTYDGHLYEKGLKNG